MIHNNKTHRNLYTKLKKNHLLLLNMKIKCLRKILFDQNNVVSYNILDLKLYLFKLFI